MDQSQPALSPEQLQELEQISQDTIIHPLPGEAELPMSAMAIRTPPLITIDPSPSLFPDAKNFCGQAAVVSVAQHHGKNQFTGTANPLQALMDHVYRKFPPDILGGMFGTSANRICSALKDCGFRQTVSMRLEPWLPGGFTNAANITAYGIYNNPIFTYVNAGYPAIVMVDNGKLGDDWHIYHWLVLYKFTGIEAFVCNATDKVNRTYHLSRINMPLFSAAWEAPYLPSGFHFNVVVAIP